MLCRILRIGLLATAALAAPPNDVDCAFRKLSLRVAARNLGGHAAKLAAVAAGLNATDCPGGDDWASSAAAAATTTAPVPPAAPVAAPAAAAAGAEVFVSPSGDDGNAGTQAAPLRTLGAAKMTVRAKLAAMRSKAAANNANANANANAAKTNNPVEPVTVTLRGGTYRETLLLGPEDSGALGGAAPVTWRAFVGEVPVISGAEQLQCAWAPTVVNGNVSAWSCVLPEGSAAPPVLSALFVGGARMQRARWPNGDPAVPCNGDAGCAEAGYTKAGGADPATGLGSCPPTATALTGAAASVLNAEGEIWSNGLVGSSTAASAAPPALTTLSAPDAGGFVHGAGRTVSSGTTTGFRDYVAYVGGGVACYNATYNRPFWNAGTCNCRSFALDEAAAARAARWRTPSTGVVHMFHSVLWGNWQFDVDSYDSGAPAGPTPAPPPTPPPTPPTPAPVGPTPAPGPRAGWSAQQQHCTSCLPHDPQIAELAEGGTLAQCQQACEANAACRFIGFAEATNQACYLFAKCSAPSHAPASQCGDASGGDHGWWTTLAYSGHGGGGGGGGTPSLKLASGGQQTAQQGRDSISGNRYFVENVFEELDRPGEWYYNASTRTLFLVPPPQLAAAGAAAAATVEVTAAVHSRVIQLRGASPTSFAHDIALRGLTVGHSAPTYTADYEMPSGGDWSIHRGGALFLDGTEDVTIDGVTVAQAGGNGIFLSNHCARTALTDNTVAGCGDSAIVLLGSTDLMNGTAPTFPTRTTVAGNLCHDVGLYGKQTAAFFKSISHATNLSRNVFFNSPRSLVNFNDAFRGGDAVDGNLLFGAVRETGDHASFNSWDRQSWFWETTTTTTATTATTTKRRSVKRRTGWRAFVRILICGNRQSPTIATKAAWGRSRRGLYM